jgi:predicted Zn-dependent protease
MIDSTIDPPKEERKTVIENLSKFAWLVLFLAACATSAPGPTPPTEVGVDVTVPSAVPPTTSPTPTTPTTPATPESPATQVGRDPIHAPVDTSKAADSGASSASDESAESPSGNARVDENSADEEAETKTSDQDEEAEESEDDSKRGRIILKTVYDDARVGEDQSEIVEAQFGLVDGSDLLEYIRTVGIRLLRHAPTQPFDYDFKIVDQSVPNAFALPGGKIYVSRGLLALVESEDELAGVLAHEITHSAERHSAARIDYAGRLNPFSIGYLRAGAIAAYSRAQEKDADRGAQIMAAHAGYDPAGIARFLRKLDASERYEVGWSRLPSFLATHPTSPKRAALASDRAAGISWERQRAVAENLPFAYYSMIDGLVIGDNPAGGLFQDGRFIHPDLGFSIRFPKDWTTRNSQEAVMAISPSRDAQAMLTVEGNGKTLAEIGEVVDDFIKREVDGIRVRVRDRRQIMLGGLPAIRIEGVASTGLGGLAHQMTFVSHEGLIYRLSILSLSSSATKYRGRGRAFAHSFRPLDEAGLHSLTVTRLRIARALRNETLQALSIRTHNELEVVFTGVMNDLFASTTLQKGRPVKIGLAEPYLPKPRDEPNEAPSDEL